MPEEMKLIQPAPVTRDDDGWWDHPSLPDFGDTEDPKPFLSWLLEQSLDIKQVSMDLDPSMGTHPYWDMESPSSGCVGWEPISPGPEWFLLCIFDTEDGPYAHWARRKVQP